MPSSADLTAADIMSVPVLSIPPETPVACIERIMRRNLISALPVSTESGKLIGIVTSTDLTAAMEAGDSAAALSAADLLSGPPLSVEPETPASAIAELFREHGIRHAPVIRADRLLGMVSETDLRDGARSARAAWMHNLSDGQIHEVLAERLKAAGSAQVQLPEFAVCDGVVRFWGRAPTAEELEAVVKAVHALES